MPKDQLRAGSAEARALLDEALASESGSAMLKSALDLYPTVMAQLALKKGANSNAQISKDDCEMRESLPEKASIDSAELMKLFRVKQMKGIVRPNGPQVQSNKTSEVVKVTTKAFALIRAKVDDVDAKIEEAITEMESLQGVGPATASLVLSYISPESIGFASDQVLDVLNRDSSRDYKIADIVHANQELRATIEKVGGKGEWTPESLGMALFVLGKANDPKVKGILNKLLSSWNSAKGHGKRRAESAEHDKTDEDPPQKKVKV